MRRILKIDPRDNVATSLENLECDAVIEIPAESEVRKVALRSPIPFGHKFALVDIGAGEAVLKYGAVVGRATKAISAGDHVHIHNIESNRGRGDRR